MPKLSDDDTSRNSSHPGPGPRTTSLRTTKVSCPSQGPAPAPQCSSTLANRQEGCFLIFPRTAQGISGTSSRGRLVLHALRCPPLSLLFVVHDFRSNVVSKTAWGVYMRKSGDLGRSTEAWSRNHDFSAPRAFSDVLRMPTHVDTHCHKRAYYPDNSENFGTSTILKQE